MADRDPYPSEKQDRFIVRLPDGMRDRIKAAAEANNRSMNAEIVATLGEKYPEPVFDSDDFAWLLLKLSSATPEQHQEMLKQVKRRLADATDDPQKIDRVHGALREIADEFVSILRASGGPKYDDPEAIESSLVKALSSISSKPSGD